MEQDLIDKGYRLYRGEKIDIYFNQSLCQHSRNCIRGNRQLFDVKRKPWISPDSVSAEVAAQVIDTCPSGALKYMLKK